MGSLFYNLIIVPLYNLMEVVYRFLSDISSPGIAVIGLSFLVTILCLPLYMVAEAWQEKERLTQKELQPGVQRIKDTFRGDEQYMILSTYYKENHYHPLMALRSSFSLLIQVPFFIAAYQFLSKLGALKGYSFLFIKDMGAPDSMFTIGNFSVNVLPIAMTIINCISGALYSHGHNFKEKIQIYVCALVFLVLLYTSPAGLVLYWTMNNILSMVKNVFYKMKKPLKVIYILSCMAELLIVIFDIQSGNKKYMICFIPVSLVIVGIPFLYKYLNAFLTNKCMMLNDGKLRFSLFISSAVGLAVLAGLAIPAFVIESSPAEYCYLEGNKSPFIFLVVPFVQSLGLFLLWPLCLFELFSTAIKKILSIVFPVLFFVGVMNCFLFSGEYGPINADLTFMQKEQNFIPTAANILLNTGAIISIFAICMLLILKKGKIVTSLVLITVFSLTVFSTKNIYSITKTYHQMTPPVVADHIDPIFHLTKTGKNVIVIMEDRCFPPVIPEVFEEQATLKQKYDGFTYYPNTVSFSYYTELGVPGILGGYDSTPWNMNQRTNETIVQKHNQAILTMPILFHSAGYGVTVSDVPYENYEKEPVTDLYKEYPYINRQVTKGTYTALWYKNHNITAEPIQTFLIKRNFIFFSI